MKINKIITKYLLTGSILLSGILSSPLIAEAATYGSHYISGCKSFGDVYRELEFKIFNDVDLYYQMNTYILLEKPLSVGNLRSEFTHNLQKENTQVAIDFKLPIVDDSGRVNGNVLNIRNSPLLIESLASKLLQECNSEIKLVRFIFSKSRELTEIFEFRFIDNKITKQYYLKSVWGQW